MASSVGEVDEKDVLDPQDIEDLYAWIDAVPLSRQKKNIARDFSDGVSVAEIVRFYLPRMVEIHNYVNANSTAQKRINWSMLNRKVFVKLSLKLNEKLVENVIESKPGAIEQILWDLRKKVLEISPKILPVAKTDNQGKGRGSFTGYSDSGSKGSNSAVGIPSTPGAHQSRLSDKGSSGNSRKVTPQRRSPAPSSAKGIPAKGMSYSAGLKDELTQFGNNVGLSGTSLCPEVSGTNTVNTGFFPGVDLNANSAAANNSESATLPPAHLIYKGHKMVPSMLLEMRNRQIRDLEVVVGGLQKKINFLDNLIQLKDNRVEDLTRQLHSLRSKFQELTQTKLPDM